MSITRAAIYARVSSDDTRKEQRNLIGQLSDCTDYAERQGYDVAFQFAEDERGLSGADPEAPQLKRAIELAQAGRFDVFVCRDIDRLARNLVKQLNTEVDLKAAGIKIEYALHNFSDNPSGRFSKNITASAAEYEREQIRERCIRGKVAAVKSGNVLTNQRPPYGRREVEIDGKRTLGIEPAEAQVIKQMYDWYIIERVSMGAIAARLSKTKTPTYLDNRPDTPLSKKQGYGFWATSTVAHILKNLVNAGIWQYRSEGKIYTIQIEPIISIDTFERAQERMKHNQSFARRNLKYPYLLRCRLKCTCGYSMISRSWYKKGELYQYYRQSHRERDLKYIECDQRKSLRADHVDLSVWGWLKDAMADPEFIPKSWQQRQQQQQARVEMLQNDLDGKDHDIQKANVNLARLLAKFWQTPDEFEASKKLLQVQQVQLEQQIAQLNTERDDLQAKLKASTITDDDIAALGVLSRRVADLLVKSKTFEQRLQVIDILDVRGIVYYDDGEPFIDIDCKIASQRRVPVVSKWPKQHGHNLGNMIVLPVTLDFTELMQEL